MFPKTSRVVAVAMLTWSLVFLATSTGLLSGASVPNCVSARVDTHWLGLGFLSHRGRSSLFLCQQAVEIVQARWNERADGHFCDFYLPTHQPNLGTPPALNLSIGTQLIATDCHYGVMAAAWVGLYWLSHRRWAFSLGDVFAAMASLAIVTVAIRYSYALIPAIALHLTTVSAAVIACATLPRSPETATDR